MNAVVTLMKDDIVFIRHFAGAASEIIQGNWSKMNFLSIRLSIIIFAISFIDDNFVTLSETAARIIISQLTVFEKSQ
jgi:hypothetical protein